MRIGVFVCHCGVNISSTVDIEQILVKLKPLVEYVTEYKYLCSEPGQDIIKQAVKKHRLEGVVIAACSPTLHEDTFRRAVASAGLNSYLCEIANIREQCSWVEKEKPVATEKAIKIINSLIEKVKMNEPLLPIEFPLVKKALVIGGGIAGMEAALNIAGSGYEVILVEKEDSLGGNLNRNYKTFPDLGTAGEILLSEIKKVNQNPRIKVLVNSRLEELKGYVGNFKATLNVKRLPLVASAQAGETFNEIDIGAIVVATGFELFFSDTPKGRDSRGNSTKYPGHKNIVDSFQFESMLKTGEIVRPSDGKIPQEIVFIQCVGFKEENPPLTYCSKICCMVTAKQAYLYKKKVPSGQAYVFYTDIRAGGKGWEEFIQKVQEEERVLYLRGRVDEIEHRGDKIIVAGVDTLSGKEIEIAADLVIAVHGLTSVSGNKELAKKLRLATNEFGFFTEAHPKLRPVETLTPGIYIAGCCQGPKDIPETISQALAASSKVLALFSGDKVLHDPQTAGVDENLCRGCRICILLCPYEAREFDYRKRKIKVVEAKCEGCGICSASCPSGAAQQKNLKDKQVEKMLEAILRN